MIRSLGSLFKRVGGLFVYLMLLILRSPVDAALCVINALFLKGVFQAIGTGELQILYIEILIQTPDIYQCISLSNNPSLLPSIAEKYYNTSAPAHKQLYSLPYGNTVPKMLQS